MTKPIKHVFSALLLATASLTASAQPQALITNVDSTVSPSAAGILGQPKSRAEVRADLILWQNAGVEEFWAGGNTSEFHTPEYRAAYAEYLRLRNGPEFTQEVERQRRR